VSLILHAPNVHQGGGRTLLLALLEAGARRGGVTAIVDARLVLPPGMPTEIVRARVRPTFPGRIAGERELASVARADDSVLCFGNLPPLFRVEGHVHLFLQNRYLLQAQDLSGFHPAARLRIRAERGWLRARIGAVERVIVQSASMRREVQAALGIDAVVLPFAQTQDEPRSASPGEPRTYRFDYVYVASGEPHKNHRRLVEAWTLLAREGIRPSLALTLDPLVDGDLCRWIEARARAHDARIELTGSLGSAQLRDLYLGARALVHASLFESFGLPLLEARAAGLPIIAPERDYVRDAIEPEQTFDPESAVSIARAVRRHLGNPEATATVLTPTQFIEAVLSA